MIDAKRMHVKMIILRTLLLYAILLLLTSCGSSTITVNVNVLSFISQEDVTFTYGEDPVIPPFGPPVTIKSPVLNVPIAGELETIVDIVDVDMMIDLLIDNDTGYANAVLSLMVAGAGEDPFETEPFLAGDIELSPDSTYTAHFRADGDERIIELFSGNEVNFGAEITFDSYGRQNLKGAAVISRFDLRVVGVGHLGSE